MGGDMAGPPLWYCGKFCFRRSSGGACQFSGAAADGDIKKSAGEYFQELQQATVIFRNAENIFRSPLCSPYNASQTHHF
jgi:hypothetical protein